MRCKYNKIILRKYPEIVEGEKGSNLNPRAKVFESVRVPYPCVQHHYLNSLAESFTPHVFINSALYELDPLNSYNIPTVLNPKTKIFNVNDNIVNRNVEIMFESPYVKDLSSPFIPNESNAKDINSFLLNKSSSDSFDISMWNIPIVVKQPATSINCDNASTSETSINSLEFENVMATGSSETHLEGHNSDPLSILRHLKSKNTDRPVIAQLNINFMAPKFEPLVSLVKDNIDLLMVSETKVDDSYPTEQFKIEGYSKPIRLDRNRHGGGLMIFSRDDLPCLMNYLQMLSAHFLK